MSPSLTFFPSFQTLRLKNTAIEEQLERLLNKAEYSPILLAWMLNHYTSENPISGSKFQQFGKKAIEQRVLKIIGDISSDPIFQVFPSDRVQTGSETTCLCFPYRANRLSER